MAAIRDEQGDIDGGGEQDRPEQPARSWPPGQDNPGRHRQGNSGHGPCGLPPRVAGTEGLDHRGRQKQDGRDGHAA